MSAKTVVTGSPLKKALQKPKGKFATVITGVQKMEKGEFRKLLMGAGIITKTGTLTSHYKDKPKPKPKAKKKAATA